MHRLMLSFLVVIVAAGCGGTGGSTGTGGTGGVGGVTAGTGGSLCLAGRDGSVGSLSTTKDVNGDGYADVIIGGNNVGAARVYHGGPCALGSSPAITLTSPVGSDAGLSQFGFSVAFAGDVNRDGYADVVVGDYPEERAYVYLGSATGIASSPATTLVGPEGGLHLFSWSVAGAGDVNGDGYADIIVGAGGRGLNGQGPGRAYVYLGGAAGLSSSPATTLTGPDGGGFGLSVAGVGDVNGDGYADVIVGAAGVENVTGRAYLYLGGASGLSSTAALVLTGPDGLGGSFGGSVANAGDVNDDGFADVIVGAPGAGVSTGHAFLYLGGASGLSATAAVRLTGPDGPNDQFGLSVAGAGDVNGDGYADVVIGAQSASQNGRAYLYLGGATAGLTSTPAVTLVSPTSGGPGFGHCVAGAGDVNGDGRVDIIVSGGYVYLGGPSGLSTTPATTLGGDGFGTPVASVHHRLRTHRQSTRPRT